MRVIGNALKAFSIMIKRRIRKMFKFVKKAKKVSIIKQLINEPEKFILTAFVDKSDELVIRIKRKEENEG